MDIHLQVVKLTQVVRGALVDSTRVAIRQIHHLHGHRLLVLLVNLGGHTVSRLTDNARRQHVRNRRAAGVLFIANRSHVEGAFAVVLSGQVVTILAQAQVIGAPIATYQLECGQTTDNRLLELTHENTHETDGIESRHVVHHFVRIMNRDAELIPLRCRTIAVGQRVRTTFIHVVDIVLAHHHLVRSQVDNILIITLIFAQSVIVVHILHIGDIGGGGGVTLGALVVDRRVAIRIVVVFVTFHHFHIRSIIVTASEIVVVIR